MMQSRSGAVQLKATIHHCRTRQGRNSLIHRYTLFLPCALRSSLSLSCLSPLTFFLRSISPSLPLTLYFSLFLPPSTFLSRTVYTILSSRFLCPFSSYPRVYTEKKGTILGPSTPLDTQHRPKPNSAPTRRSNTISRSTGPRAP